MAIQNVDVKTTVLQRGVEGTDCLHMLLFIPLGSLVVNYEEAVDNALAKVPEANALENVSMYLDPIVTFVYNVTCLRVKGDAVKVAAGGPR